MKIRVLAASAVLATTGAVLPHGAASAAPSSLSFCIDKASASAGNDRKMAADIARAENATPKFEVFDSEADYDDGVSPKEFAKLLDTRCEFVMGFPVEDGTPPDRLPGIAETAPYAHTGFVLAVPAGAHEKALADFAPGTQVAVTFETAPNLYFLEHKNVIPDVHSTEGDTLKALVDGKTKAAIVWQPTIEVYNAAHQANFVFYPLQEPHARFGVVALYAPRSADEAKGFNDAVHKIEGAAPAQPAPADKHADAARKESGGGFDPAMVHLVDVGAAVGGVAPALYTKEQMESGESKFSAYCSGCHGDQLQGKAGPALKGPNFGSSKSGFSVGDVFTIISNNMPAGAPGTLQHDDYVEIMAFLLQQNGYPAGSTKLEYDSAGSSNVPFSWHGK